MPPSEICQLLSPQKVEQINTNRVRRKANCYYQRNLLIRGSKLPPTLRAAARAATALRRRAELPLRAPRVDPCGLRPRRAASQGRRRPHDAPARVEVHRTHVARELVIQELGRLRKRTASLPPLLLPSSPRLPVPQALWHPLIDVLHIRIPGCRRGEIAISKLGCGHPDRASGEGEGVLGAFPFVRLLVCYRPLAHAFLASVFWPQHDLSHNFLDSQLAPVRH